MRYMRKVVLQTVRIEIASTEAFRRQTAPLQRMWEEFRPEKPSNSTFEYSQIGQAA